MPLKQMELEYNNMYIPQNIGLSVKQLDFNSTMVSEVTTWVIQTSVHIIQSGRIWYVIMTYLQPGGLGLEGA